MRSPRRRRLLVPAALLAGAVALAAVASTQAQTSRSVLAGTKPAWTAAATPAGTLAPTQAIRAKVWLAPRNAAQLDALARAVSDPQSAQYRQFLTADQYRAQFAPTADQVAAVTQWLQGAGLMVSAAGPSNHYLAVSGSAAAAGTAFGTEIGTYVVKGQRVQAPTTDLSVPSSVASSVLAITGLTTFGHVVKPADLGAPDAFVNGTPCSSYYSEQLTAGLPPFHGDHLPYAVCGYTPNQLRSAYGDDDHSIGGHAGAGQSVAITDAYDAPWLRSDANQYSTRHGDKPFERSQFRDRSVPEDTSTTADCGGNGWYGEQTLDVEAVHGMAQAARVLYYGGASCFDDDLLAALSSVVDDNDASIVTNSWGEPTFVNIGGTIYATIDRTLIDAYESVFKQGAVQGIGFYYSSGDDGDNLDAWGVLAPDFPAEDPWVTAVGGTSLAVGHDGSRLFETGWGTSKWALNGSDWTQTVPFLYGAGGGFTLLGNKVYFGFDRPWYQDGVVNSHGRGVPDIGLDGDPTTGMLVGETQNFPTRSRYGRAGVHYGEYRIGGTSLSSPLFAGIQAVAQSTDGSGGRIGFANPRIYHLFTHAAGVYFDVTPQGDHGNVRSDYVNGINASDGKVYSVRTFDQDSSLTTDVGWDDVTGVGSPTADYIAIAAAH